MTILRGATILTGFLGSGKTTLLNRVLRDPRFSRSAVLVNEFGQIGIDNALLRYSSERIAVIAGGCICCSVREDVEEAVRLLFQQEGEAAIPAFDHLFVETSGLADPAPLIQTFHSSPALRSRVQLTGVVATVDAMLGAETINRFAEAARQVALANLVLITKIDLLAEEALARVDELGSAIKSVNPTALSMTVTPHTEEWLDVVASLNDASGREVQPRGYVLASKPAHLLSSGIQSFGVTIEEPIDWTTFGVWLTWLLHVHGPSVLRVKGLVQVQQSSGPVGFHAVQHMVFPPEHFADWPDNRRGSQITFIVKDLDPTLVERSLRAFLRIGSSSQVADEGLTVQRPLGGGGSIRGRPIKRPHAPSWLK